MSDHSKALHVAVLAFPFGSHAAPLLALVCRLATSNPTVRFSFLSTAQSNTRTFPSTRTNEFDNVRPYNVWDGVPEGHQISGNPHVGTGFFLKALPQNFKAGMAQAEEESGATINCLLTDAFLWFAGDLAEEMGVPWVPYWTAGACSLSAHVNTDVIRITLGSTQDVSGSLGSLPGPVDIRDLSILCKPDESECGEGVKEAEGEREGEAGEEEVGARAFREDCKAVLID
ncbi:UDP-glucosyl transferase 78D3 [Actinidia rufa]|uniref:UDP-glucosyl transferase 78D3 n=1 Tax=Actinidia rufa TaxID=165716 RepID=A0A7J0DJ07_9ERIC|nr:UDP-glucosyl transferase 78D3 [Actinidia rufa]